MWASQVSGLLDSGLWIDVEPYNTAVLTLMTQTQQAFKLFNSTRLARRALRPYPRPLPWPARLALLCRGRGLAREQTLRLPILRLPTRAQGPNCERLYPSAEDQWMCLFGEYRCAAREAAAAPLLPVRTASACGNKPTKSRHHSLPPLPPRSMPMLETPYMLNYAQFDKFELPYNIGARVLRILTTFIPAALVPPASLPAFSGASLQALPAALLPHENERRNPHSQPLLGVAWVPYPPQAGRAWQGTR